MVGVGLEQTSLSYHQRDSSLITLYKFREWYSFLDMDNFNSEHLVSTLINKDPETELPFLWTRLPNVGHQKCNEVPVIALKQAEAVFNLSQLMFALYHGSLTACTFCDLQLSRPPRDIRKNGFNKLGSQFSISGTTFRKALHDLCWEIAENGGLPVIFSMMKNPLLPIIKQKSLDALTNILCVDSIEKVILEHQPWFLEELVSMIKNGELQCDMVPAVSVLDRIVVVILTDRLQGPYDQLLRLKFIQVCLKRLTSSKFSTQVVYLHFVKFQTISMQAIALLCADEQSRGWSKELQDDIFNYAYRSVLMWNTDQPPTEPIWHQSEAFYRSMSFSSSALLFSFIVLVHAILKWPGKRDHLMKEAVAFKYQLSRLLTLEGFAANPNQADNEDPNNPIILNVLNWMWSTLYEPDDEKTPCLYQSVIEPLPELCEKVLRNCSYQPCRKREDKAGQWRCCSVCSITCYCCEECENSHKGGDHNLKACKFLAMGKQ